MYVGRIRLARHLCSYSRQSLEESASVHASADELYHLMEFFLHILAGPINWRGPCYVLVLISTALSLSTSVIIVTRICTATQRALHSEDHNV